MLATVVPGGRIASRALLYQEPDINVVNYVSESMSNLFNRIGSASSAFFNNVKNTFQNHFSTDAYNTSRLILSQYGNSQFTESIIPITMDNYYVHDIYQQRYMMCLPELDNMYSKNQCHAYGDLYVDIEPNNRGTERIGYMNVMDGIMETENEDELGMVTTYSHSHFDLYGKPLDTLDQFNIIKSWDVLSKLILKDIDPTEEK